MNGLLSLLVLGVALAQAESEPALRCTVDVDAGMLIVDGLPMVLDDAEVSRHLRSGLTTTLELKLEARSGGQRIRTTRRFRIRFEPWEEVYLVGHDQGEGAPSQRPPAELRAWWRSLDLAVELPPGTGARSWRATLEVEVVPFSEAEREDAQRWLARSGRGAPDSPDRSASDDGREVGSLLELVMATGIDRRAILGSTWRLDCHRGAP